MDTQTDTQTQTVQAEQAADLAALQAAAVEGQTAPGTPGAEAPVAPALEKELAGLLLMVSAMLKPALPSVAAIYTQETCEAVGLHVANVCNKHGWLQGGIGGKYGEEIMCLAVVGPIAWATVEAAKTDIQARKATAKKSAGTSGGADIEAKPVAFQANPNQDGKAVTVGAPIEAAA